MCCCRTLIVLTMSVTLVFFDAVVELEEEEEEEEEEEAVLTRRIEFTSLPMASWMARPSMVPSWVRETERPTCSINARLCAAMSSLVINVFCCRAMLSSDNKG